MSVGINGLAGLDAITFPLPDYDSWEIEERNRANLAGLGIIGIPETQGPGGKPIPQPGTPLVETLTRSADAINLQIAQIAKDRQSVIDDYYAGKFAGKTASPYNYLLSRLGEYDKQTEEYQKRLTEINAKIAGTSAEAPAPGALPAGEASRQSLQEYARQVQLLKMGGFYDFGAGSSRRNLIFKNDAGMSGLGNFDWLETNANPLTYLAVALAVYLLLRRK